MTDKALNWMKNPPKKLFEGMGYYVGIANTNKPVVTIDTWRESNANEENTNIVGVTGTGMSFTTKLKIARKRGINYGEEA